MLWRAVWAVASPSIVILIERQAEHATRRGRILWVVRRAGCSGQRPLHLFQAHGGPVRLVEQPFEIDDVQAPRLEAHLTVFTHHEIDPITRLEPQQLSHLLPAFLAGVDLM